jgi:hypothetical protein
MQGGDRLFVTATRDNELYLLGLLEVSAVHRTQRAGARLPIYRAIAKRSSGPFRIIPLGSLKWRLRFESEADRLSRTSSVAMQVRKHRFLTEQSARLLQDVLKSEEKLEAQILRTFKTEGAPRQQMVSVRE